MPLWTRVASIVQLSIECNRFGGMRRQVVWTHIASILTQASHSIFAKKRKREQDMHAVKSKEVPIKK